LLPLDALGDLHEEDEDPLEDPLPLDALGELYGELHEVPTAPTRQARGHIFADGRV